MNTRNTNRVVLTLAVVAMACLTFAGSVQAAVITVGSTNFSLSSSTSSGTVHDNLPAAFESQVAPGTITPTSGFSVHPAGYALANVTDGDRTTGSSGTTWANNSDASGTLTLTFPNADIAGLAFNWAWGDRTPGDYEVVINGGSSLGTFRVDTAGGTSSAESSEPNTYVLFNAVQPSVTSIDIKMSSGNNNSWGLDEVEVYTGTVPEPATMGLLALGGLALLKRRNRA